MSMQAVSRHDSRVEIKFIVKLYRGLESHKFLFNHWNLPGYHTILNALSYVMANGANTTWLPFLNKVCGKTGAVSHNWPFTRLWQQEAHWCQWKFLCKSTSVPQAERTRNWLFGNCKIIFKRIPKGTRVSIQTETPVGSKWLGNCDNLLAVSWFDSKAVYFLGVIDKPQCTANVQQTDQVVKRGSKEGGGECSISTTFERP